MNFLLLCRLFLRKFLFLLFLLTPTPAYLCSFAFNSALYSSFSTLDFKHTFSLSFWEGPLWGTASVTAINPFQASHFTSQNFHNSPKRGFLEPLYCSCLWTNTLLLLSWVFIFSSVVLGVFVAEQTHLVQFPRWSYKGSEQDRDTAQPGVIINPSTFSFLWFLAHPTLRWRTGMKHMAHLPLFHAVWKTPTNSLRACNGTKCKHIWYRLKIIEWDCEIMGKIGAIKDRITEVPGGGIEDLY